MVPPINLDVVFITGQSPSYGYHQTHPFFTLWLCLYLRRLYLLFSFYLRRLSTSLVMNMLFPWFYNYTFPSEVFNMHGVHLCKCCDVGSGFVYLHVRNKEQNLPQSCPLSSAFWCCSLPYWAPQGGLCLFWSRISLSLRWVIRESPDWFILVDFLGQHMHRESP